jgi:hypothetical protein
MKESPKEFFVSGGAHIYDNVREPETADSRGRNSVAAEELSTKLSLNGCY